LNKRIAVLLSGRGSNFQSILAARHSGTLGGQVDIVISNRPGAGGLDIAREAAIQTALIDHQSYESREAFDADLASVLESQSLDLVVLAGFMRILTPGFVSRFAGRLMNIHPSLLPLYPGLHTHQRALDAGDSHAGATVHYVTGELDGGPPILQAKVAVQPDDDEESLAARVLQVESDELVDEVRANNVPVEYVLFEDEGHGFRKRVNRITASEAYLQFLNTHL